jgi:heptosyltransferase-1
MLKLLIVKTSSLGDVIHNLPIIHDICTHYPNIQIDWIVEESFADIPRLHPKVNKVITVALRRWRKNLLSKKTWQEIFAFRRSIRQEQYDLVLDTQGLLKSGLIGSMSRGEKHGYDKKSIREPLATFFYNIRHSVSRKLHAVSRNRYLAAASLDYQSPSDIPEYGIKALKTPDIKLTQAYVIGLHGTSRDSKLWPTEHWITLGQALAKQKMHLALPWASEAEHQRAMTIANTLNNAILLPKLSIGELAGVISHAKYAIGVDTGLSHLAVAVGVPTVAIYTDTDPALTGVLAGEKAPAINLGNKNQIPSVQAVLTAILSVSKK